MSHAARAFLRRLLAALLALAAAGGARAASDGFLDYDQAFAFSARVLDARTVEARWTIADGYYLYHDRIAFAADGARLGAPQMPRGTVKFDENFGKEVETHRGELVVRVPLTAFAGGELLLTARSQGCADRGLCYPPTEQQARLTLAAVAGEAGGVSGVTTGDETARIEQALRSRSLWAVLPLFLLLGVLLSFTPCVLPMVPILSSIIVGQQGAMTRARGFALALAYSLGMALVYTALGVAAGLAGEGLAAALQTPAVLGAFAVLLVLLALSMFGFYELQLPAAWQARLANASNARRGGTYAGVFAMGAISALVVGPCVAAPLAGTLLFISQTRDVLIGGAALFALAAGMSVPLLLVGLSAGSLLPRAGAWMEGVKTFFGALLLATALWMVAPVIPAWGQMLGWAALLVIGAVYLGAVDPLPVGASGWRRLGKGVGVLLLLGGAVQIVGVATGGRDVLQPLAHLVPPPAGASSMPARDDAGPRWVKVASVEELERALAAARGRPALLDFYADWCVSCIEMERFTFRDERVAQRMQQMLLLKADVTKNTEADRALLKRFNLFGPPGIVLFDCGGREVPGARM
ncbi:MAG: protein-disulfide reductase DsbD, partial [Burkholderiaceae bacterium]|nr:protein-disulfide reductase DsbD [Burkholderiaceae bacterium]